MTSGVFGPNRISNSIGAASDFFTFSALVYQAQYETPSIFSIRSENDVGRAGGVNVGVGVGVGDGLAEGLADGVALGEGVALGDGLATGAGTTGYGAQIIVEAPSSDIAVDAALVLFNEAVKKANLPAFEIIKAETMSEDQDWEDALEQ